MLCNPGHQFSQESTKIYLLTISPVTVRHFISSKLHWLHRFCISHVYYLCWCHFICRIHQHLLVVFCTFISFEGECVLHSCPKTLRYRLFIGLTLWGHVLGCLGLPLCYGQLITDFNQEIKYSRTYCRSSVTKTWQLTV